MQRLLKYLKTRPVLGATTLEIARACDSTRPSSDISELNACGIRTITKYEGISGTGRRIFSYRLAKTEAGI